MYHRKYKKKSGLKTFENIFEIISSEQHTLVMYQGTFLVFFYCNIQCVYQKSARFE